MRNLSLILMAFCIATAIPAKISGQNQGNPASYKLEGKDTVYQMTLREVYHFSWDGTKKKGREWRQFYKLVYNFGKTYPYALTARDKIREADSIIANSDFTAAQKERFIKEFEEELFREFEKPLRKMTFSQGKLLLKLIDREIGQSSYSIIKNYRGGIAAGFWQGVAKIFGSDLKKPYDRFGEDKIVEELVQMHQRGSFEFLYYSIFR
jgi:hypothetical protein